MKNRLVYLDDEEINLMFFREMFKNDFEIFTTDSPEKALSYLRSNEVDFVVTDQLMPEMTGIEFLKMLETEGISEESKKIMISGYAKQGEIREALDTKLIDEFVGKPWSYNGVINLLRKN